jgi:hypothetical protein
MPDSVDPDQADQHTGDIRAGDRRLSRPDASLPNWEVPDSAYRPVPIVWFTGAMILQLLVLGVLFFALLGANGLYTVVAGSAATGTIGAWTWRRGMASAAASWQVVTIAMLALQLAFVILAASPRI